VSAFRANIRSGGQVSKSISVEVLELGKRSPQLHEVVRNVGRQSQRLVEQRVSDFGHFLLRWNEMRRIKVKGKGDDRVSPSADIKIS
jgi:hypothetical protein